MDQELYRQTALQTLASPERLDQVMSITSRRAWIGLGAMGLLLLAALLWGLFGSLPTSISGQGIIVRKGGIFNVVSSGNGAISELTDLRAGSSIRKGQVLGKISQPALVLQRELAHIELVRLQAEESAVQAALRAQAIVHGRVVQEQKELQNKIIEAKQKQVESLRRVLLQQEELLRDGLIPRSRSEEVRQAVLASQNEIASAQSQFQKLAMLELETADQRAERLRTVRARIEQVSGKYQALQAQLQQESEIVSELDGLVVEMMAMQGDTVKVGQPILSIEQIEKHLEVMIFLPPNVGTGALAPGLPVHVMPADAKAASYGYLIGKVGTVAKYPATEQGMMAILNNAGLVRQLTQAGPPRAVTVQLDLDPHTVSGYQWSGAAGARVKLASGTLASATLITDSRRPISLLLPALREGLGL